MPVDELSSIFKGKRVKLTLKTSSVFGVVQRINSNKTLVLDVSSSDGCRIPGTKLFFGPDILNVEFVSEANGDRGDSHHHRSEEHLNIEKFQPYRKTITLDVDEEEEEYINFVVIDEFHAKFGPAVMHIKKQQVIGVGAEGVELSKNGRLCWLQIATKNKVYLFDVLLLGARAFKNGLSMILESKHILKVIHDCRAISRCLIAQFGVKLTNVFDTQVADVMCFHSETGGFLPDRVGTLHEVVSLHLKVPSSQLSSLQMMSQLTKEESEVWYKRPCPVPLLKVIALSVIHLQPLRLVLLDSLMTDYMNLVDSYLTSSHYNSETVCLENMLELPRELRQLDEIRHKRHEWASSYYPLTEPGLLARFNPVPQSPTQGSPAAEDQSKKKPDFPEPANLDTPSSQMELLFKQAKTSPLRVTNDSAVDVSALAPAAVSDFSKEMSVNSSLSAGMGRGHIKVQVDMNGCGMFLGKEQTSTPVFPSIGRGFLLRVPPTQIPREHVGDNRSPYNMEMVSFQDKMPKPDLHENGLPKDAGGLRGKNFTPAPQPLSSSLAHSFRSFRF